LALHGQDAISHSRGDARASDRTEIKRSSFARVSAAPKKRHRSCIRPSSASRLSKRSAKMARKALAYLGPTIPKIRIFRNLRVDRRLRYRRTRALQGPVLAHDSPTLRLTAVRCRTDTAGGLLLISIRWSFRRLPSPSSRPLMLAGSGLRSPDRAGARTRTLRRDRQPDSEAHQVRVENAAGFNHDHAATRPSGCGRSTRRVVPSPVTIHIRKTSVL
jgi:hypothetical protein